MKDRTTTGSRKRPDTGTTSGKPRRSRPAAPAEEKSESPPMWELRLYVAGTGPRSTTAYQNLKRLCEEHIPGQYRIELIDLLKDPQLARADQILAIPTLVRKLPDPLKRIIGDLSDPERALISLDLRPAG
jgi:circadian clock protein KaiB